MGKANKFSFIYFCDNLWLWASFTAEKLGPSIKTYYFIITFFSRNFWVNHSWRKANTSTSSFFVNRNTILLGGKELCGFHCCSRHVGLLKEFFQGPFVVCKVWKSLLNCEMKKAFQFYLRIDGIESLFLRVVNEQKGLRFLFCAKVFKFFISVLEVF